MKRQFGASILSQMLQELAFARGHKVKCHIQENVGGNTDFLNMMNTSRLASKKISKENVIRCQHDIRGLDSHESFLYAGPSNYIAYYKDNKIANFHLELEGFGGSPVSFDARLSVIDSPNSAGVVIDAIRYLKVARELGITGSLHGASAFTQKTPPFPMTFEDAQYECKMLAKRQLTELTKKQVRKEFAQIAYPIIYNKEKGSKDFDSLLPVVHFDIPQGLLGVVYCPCLSYNRYFYHAGEHHLVLNSL